ncbi:Fe-S cluster assembly ATPase SufC, partial [Burkholderia multivorans]
MSKLKISDLHVSVNTEAGQKPILNGINLEIDSNQTHAIMGPN